VAADLRLKQAAIEEARAWAAVAKAVAKRVAAPKEEAAADVVEEAVEVVAAADAGAKRNEEQPNEIKILSFNSGKNFPDRSSDQHRRCAAGSD
jgi:hypothetical protein